MNEKSQPQPQRGYQHLNDAWYTSSAPREAGLVDDVFFALYYADGSVAGGEVRVAWYELGNQHVPRLEVYGEAWGLLGDFADVLAAFAQRGGQHITPGEFCDLLKAHGFADLTMRAMPERVG